MQGNPISEEKLNALLRTDEGKKLLQLLNRDGGKVLRQIAAAAQAGNYQAAREQLQPLIAAAEVQKLLEALGKQHG